MPRFTLLRRIFVACFSVATLLLLATVLIPETSTAADNATTQLFSPFTPMEDPNRAMYALGVLFRANLADLAAGEATEGMVRYPGPLRRLGLRVNSGQQVRIVGLDGGLRVELRNGEGVEGRRVKDGYAWTKTP